MIQPGTLPSATWGCRLAPHLDRHRCLGAAGQPKMGCRSDAFDLLRPERWRHGCRQVGLGYCRPEPLPDLGSRGSGSGSVRLARIQPRNASMFSSGIEYSTLTPIGPLLGFRASASSGGWKSELSWSRFFPWPHWKQYSRCRDQQPVQKPPPRPTTSERAKGSMLHRQRRRPPPGCFET